MNPYVIEFCQTLNLMSYAFRKILNYSEILNQLGLQNIESIAKYGKYDIESPSQIPPIIESSKHSLQNIESATKSLPNIESIKHTMVHDESTNVRPLNIQTIAFFSSVLKQHLDRQHVKRRCPGVNTSKPIATLFSDQASDVAQKTYTATNIRKRFNV